MISKNDWTQAVFPGTRMHMSIALTSLRVNGNQCPRRGCRSMMTFQTCPIGCVQALYVNTIGYYMIRQF